MADKERSVSTIQLDPSARYLFCIDGTALTQEEGTQLLKRLEAWWQSGKPFAIVELGRLRLRVEKCNETITVEPFVSTCPHRGAKITKEPIYEDAGDGSNKNKER